MAEHIARTVMSAATVGTRRGQDERHGERKPARSALARKASPTAARVSLRTSVFGPAQLALNAILNNARSSKPLN